LRILDFELRAGPRGPAFVYTASSQSPVLSSRLRGVSPNAAEIESLGTEN